MPPLWRNRNFVLLWLAYGVSAFGDHLSELALLKLQHALDPGVTDVTRRQAIMLFVFMAPFVLFGPIFGWVADRLPRRAIMIAADLIRAAIMFEMFSILLGLHRWMQPGDGPQAAMSITVAIFPLALLGVFASMFSPARLALLPTLVAEQQIIRANASTSGLGMIASIASFYAGAWLVVKVSPAANFRLDALTFVFSAACIFLVRPPAVHHRATRSHVASAVLDGFRYLGVHRRAAEMIFVATIFWAAASVIRSVIPAIVRDVFGGSYAQIGIYQGLLGVGILAGSIILTLMGQALRSELAISWCLKLAGLAGLLLTSGLLFRFHPYLCASAIFLIGMFGAGILVSANALLQRIVPDYLRGRIFGVTDLCSMTGLLLATGVLGIPTWPEIDRHVGWITGLVSISLFVIGIWTTMMRLKRGRFGRVITFWRNINIFYCRLWPRMQRVGRCTMPTRGPVIVAANHNSFLDPFVLTASSPNRSIGFMIAREYAVIPGFRRIIEAIECVPVTRSGNDTASIKAALRHLADGKTLGIFPQGRIQYPGEAIEVREGIGMLALRSGATVIPAYIWGIRQVKTMKRSFIMDLYATIAPFLSRHQARIRYGPPVDLSRWADRRDREAYREAAEHIMERILALAPREDWPGEQDASRESRAGEQQGR